MSQLQAMEDLVSKGLVKAIGISNFSITKTKRLLQTAKIVPAVNQVECHPYLQQDRLKEYCDVKGVFYAVNQSWRINLAARLCFTYVLAGIVLEAYSPFINPGSPYKNKEDPNLFEDPVITEIALKHKVTKAQVLTL